MYNLATVMNAEVPDRRGVGRPATSPGGDADPLTRIVRTYREFADSNGRPTGKHIHLLFGLPDEPVLSQPSSLWSIVGAHRSDVVAMGGGSWFGASEPPKF